MLIKKEKFCVDVYNEGFNLISEGEEVFFFNVKTTVNDDENEKIESFEHMSENTFQWVSKSSIWDKKIYTLIIEEENLIYSVKVHGSGKLGKVMYLNESDFNTSGYYLPAIHGEGEVNPHYLMTKSCINDLMFLTPPPLCYIFDMEQNPMITGVGLLTEKGKYNFDYFNYEYKDNRCSFVTDFYEYTKVCGEFELPSIIVNVGKNEEDILRKYADYHYVHGYCNKDEKKPFKWWYGPLFCGWGDQWVCLTKKQEKDINWAEQIEGKPVEEIIASALDASNENEYRKMLNSCKEKDITITAVIIDDKWQKEYGTLEADTNKWPDMRKFIDECHSKGLKVKLWVKLWNCEGLPDEECVLKDGKAIYVDPTSPEYIKRLEKSLYRLLSNDEGCYNADGFKLDFANVMPLGEGLQIHEKGVYGIELLKRLLSLFYKISKQIKPDALISTSCAHPYFREVTDMFRLHDYYAASNNGFSNLQARTMLGTTMLGDDILVDTDGMSGARRRDAMLGFRNCTKFGIPDLYGVELFSFLSDDDWKEVSEIYKNYHDSIDKKFND